MKQLIAGLLIVFSLGACQTPVTPEIAPKTSLPSGNSSRLVAALTSSAAQRLSQQGISVHSLLPEKQIFSLTLPAGQSLQTWRSQLSQTSGVSFVEEVVSYQLNPLENLQPVTVPVRASGPSGFQTLDLSPNDPQFRFQWNLRSIGMPKAWDLATAAREVTVAVIDSGIDPEHPDLKPHLLPMEDIWSEFAGQDRVVNRSTGEAIEFSGRDGNGHGTHVAGVIAALLNNNQGVAGIAGGGVKLLPIKVTNLAGATDSVLLVEAIKRAIDKGADVINMSIGTLSAREPLLSQSLEAAIDLASQRGILVVAAAGNESDRSAGSVEGVTVPAAYPKVIAVGAFNEAGGIANYSNGGPELDILAPGGEGSDPILSTWPTYATLENLQRRVRTLNYAMASGTSMAAPHVSAVAALLLAREPEMTPAQVRARLIATADDTGVAGFDADSGYGRLNADRALRSNGDAASF